MKKSYPSVTKQLVLLGRQLLVMGLSAQTAFCAGQAYIPGYYGNAASILPPSANTLPSGATIISGIDGIDTSVNEMTVHQGKPRAVIHWQNFDIGSDASVHFDQKDASYKALNRVTGDGYSQIFGRLTAKGQVYILNQNGILFGPGSQVNVHSLTASALNLDENDFLNLADFSQGGKETYTYSPGYSLDATVANHGTLTAGNLGSVFLIGPQVENNGTITAPGGHINLLAGGRVEIAEDEFAEFSFNVAGDGTSGTATNYVDGKIVTEKGWAGMYGSFVNQEGLIRAVTALEKNGRIVLQATKRVRTGANSHTEVLVADSGDRKIVKEDTFKQSEIKIRAEEGIIDHFGHILAPGGDVSLIARDRVILENGSSIDVGGSWVELTAKERLVEVQLNSEELRDAFIYKYGPLKGETVQVDIVAGLDFANISGYLKSKDKSAPELTTKGGSISLVASGDNGEVIVNEGASVDFSGGGLIYADGLVAATMVRIGNKIFSLQDMPSGVPVDAILGHFEKHHERYGITNEWSGLYYGGSSPYLSYLDSFIQGSDAGSLNILARKMILDGSMNASVLRGIYQDLEEEPKDENGNYPTDSNYKRATISRAAPRAGTLKIGESPGNAALSDLKTDAIVIKKEVAATTVSGEELLADYNDEVRLSELSAEKINAAGLGTLQLYANTTIETQKNAELTLASLGAVDFAAQNIVHRGLIRIPSGTVNLTLRGIEGSGSTIPDVRDRIFLAAGSVIDVSGERLDNSISYADTPLKFGFTFGGKVHLDDNNAQDNGEIILAHDSIVNAGGGYMINRDTSIDGGKAGSITLKGNTVQPGGTLVGLALEGSEGGSLSIHADELTVAASAPFLPYDFEADDELPENLQHQLILAENSFNNSGFSHIELKSEGDLLVEEGIAIASSSARLAKPALTATGYNIEESKTVTVLPEYFGSSSISLAAGQEIYTSRQGMVNIALGASLTVGPAEGKISLTGDDVNISGNLAALGGDIAINANNDIVLSSSATVDVSGTSLPDPENSLLRLGLNKSVVGGGSVSLAATGDVILEEGSLIDVSGSEPVTNRTVDDQRNIIETTLASAAGSVDVNYGDTFTSDGTITGRSQFSWLSGGSLRLAKTSNTTLTIKEESVIDWQKNGFDDFNFSSRRAIGFIESTQDNDQAVTIAAQRALTLNASTIVGSENQEINLSAPWLTLTNIVAGADSDSHSERSFGTVAKGSAQLALSGEFIDIQGNIALSGFAETTVQSANDLRLYDYYYFDEWAGALRTAGNLTMQAMAIYPGMHHSLGTWEGQENTHKIYPSSFTISAGLTDSNGNIRQGEGSKITILAPEQNVRRDIYSAGGKLTLKAGDIEHHGVLAAPMGEINLTAENRIVLGDDSILSTRGEAMTLYGLLEDEQWTVGGYGDNSTPNPQIPVTEAPEKSVKIAAREISQTPDATIDVGGGGSIFAYQFLPGYDGTINPLGKENRYVILPDNSVILPGKTVYLEGVDGLASGTYSLLPAEYAFLPGAIVIEDSGEAVLPGEKIVTSAGYTMTAGYMMSDRSITAASPLRTGYIIRNAGDVLAEGRFDTVQKIAGDAGMVQITAGTGSSNLDGAILGDAMTGYLGGSLLLAAENLFVGSVASLTEEEEDDYNLIFNINKIKNKGIRSLELGDSTTGTTKTVTFGTGSTIDDIQQVEITATDSITLQQGTQIHTISSASDQLGILTLNTGTLYGSDDTLLHASDELYFNINNLSADTFTGNIQVDHGSFQVDSDVLYLEPSSYSDTRSTGFYLSAAFLNTFKSIDNVILKSASDMIFLGDVNLAAKGDLTLDSARLTVDNSLSTVNINAGGALRLLNSNATSTGNDANNTNTINLTAQTIAFGPGDMKLDNFNDIHFASSGETIFNGTGTLDADLAADGKLSFSASRYLSAVTHADLNTDADGNEFISYELSDFTIDSHDGDIFMAGNGLDGSSTMAMPGNLTITGTNIHLDNAVYNMPGGFINFQADHDIIAINSKILAVGERLNFPVTIGGTLYNNTISLAGGQVSMQSDQGRINIDSTTIIDTSTKTEKEGGKIILSAQENGVVVDGTIQGDRIVIDTDSIDDFGTLSRTITAGGFNKLVDLRARKNNVTIGAADTVKTDHFILSADQGAIDIFGTIDVSGADKGGIAEIYANGDLTLQTTGNILARGEGENGVGGSVFLQSANGAVKTLTGTDDSSLIDVSGGTEGQGGKVTFRALRDVISTDEMLLDGEIRGASKINAHAFRVYTDTTITSTDVTQYMNDISAEWAALQASWKYDNIELIPEIEVRSNSSLTIASGLDNLNSLTTSRLNGTPGIFTFRATTGLNVTSNIIDVNPSSRTFNWFTYKNEYVPVSDGIRDSWDLNFVAGADMTSSRLLTAREGGGNFVLGTYGNGKLIYTESGTINVAAGNDLIIHALKTTGSNTTVPESYMPGTDRYNLASFDGAINGYVGHDLLLQGGIIQTALADIDLQIKNNVAINPFTVGSKKYYGAIRTTGRAPLVQEIPELVPFLNDPQYSSYLDAIAQERFWDYRDGGNITVTADGDITGSVAQPNGEGWDYAYNDLLTAGNLGLEKLEKYGAAYGLSGFLNGSKTGQSTHGIATMAGGRIDIKAEDIYGQVGAFKEGDLSIYARGTLDGRFLAAGGDIHLTSLADFGNTTDNATREDTMVELGSGRLEIEALGNVSLGTISNPTFTRLGAEKVSDSNLMRTWLLTYDENSSVTINAALGDTVFSGNQDFVVNDNYFRYALLPSSLSVTSGNDIRFALSRSNPFILAPSANGHLSLIAGHDINGKSASTQDTASYSNSALFMSAADPAEIYGDKGAEHTITKDVALLKYGNTVPEPLHINNFIPVSIQAGRDIANISLSVPKQAEINAERDIREIGYRGQNLREDDVSLVSAGRNLVQQPYEGKNLSLGDLSINQAGHGFLLVEAGDSIDLGSTGGIQSTGNNIAASYQNSALFDDNDKDSYNRYKGADIAVISGYDLGTTNEALAVFFDALNKEGKKFSTLMATGKQEDENEAAQLKEAILTSIINPLLEGHKTGNGDIAMTQSTIRTASGQDDLYILAAGQIDVGTSIISDKKDTAKGILTEGGGGINIFAEKDINVNESRVVSYFGGDIFMLSNHGDINAGRGSKTAVTPRDDNYITVGGKLVRVAVAPAPGSGMLADTFDPDGAGPITKPKKGDATLIAWEGVIDAGEAGISADNVIIAATKVLNSDNISVGESGVGVPVTTDAGPSLGALAGSTTVSGSQDATKSIGQTIDSGKQLAETMSRMSESLSVKMLIFKLEGFSDTISL